MHFVVGDIHSNFQELSKLISSINPGSDDEIIFLGDILDKGASPLDTLQLISALQCRKTYIMGDHEYVWKQYLLENKKEREDFILKYGGVSTVDKQLIDHHDLAEIRHILRDYLAIIRIMKPYYIWGDYFATHAGLLKNQLNERELVFEEMNYFLRPHDIDVNNRYLGKYRVISGHTHVDTSPRFYKGYINIDTGAGYNKFLTAYIIENKLAVRSDGKIFKDQY